MGQYYRYYDANGRSVYTEVQTLAGPEQAQRIPRGAVELDEDAFRDAQAAIEHATAVAERSANALAAVDVPDDPPAGEKPPGGKQFTSRGVV